MIKYIYNTTEDEIVYKGKAFPALGYRAIPDTMEAVFASDSTLLVDIANEVVIMSKTEDSSGHITDVNIAIDFLKNNLSRNVQITGLAPFADKALPNGSKLFTRIHGIVAAVTGTTENIDFLVPYSACKISGIQILNGVLGDSVNLKILDTPSGLISGIPYLALNQFGYNVKVAESNHTFTSNYDADLIQNLTLRLEYTSVSSRSVYINFFLHQVV